MALADYFSRSALAVAQIAHGYDEKQLAALLNSTSVGVSLTDAGSPEASALAEMVVRLVSRLYPRMSLIVRKSQVGDELAALATAINPSIELTDEQPEYAIVVGDASAVGARASIRVGSDGWNSFLSMREAVPVGTSTNPFGSGVAACLGVAELFRRVIEGPAEQAATFAFSTWTCGLGEAQGPPIAGDVTDAVIVGGGAIGNATTWALARTELTGVIHLVDHESVELSNIQRYVLTNRTDEGADKSDLLAARFRGPLEARPTAATWQEFVAANGYMWRWALVGLDSARDRRAVQATLPEHIINAWTQPGDLGVSVHPALDAGACLACLYLPTGQVPNEDELVAQALRLDHARFGLQIRQLLEAGAAPPPDLLDHVAARLEVGPDQIRSYASRPLRDLYVEGVCGGGLVPLDKVGSPNQALHVPLAHQSALAGILLAAKFVRLLTGHGPDVTEVTRLNVMREISQHPTQPAAKRGDRRCICEDPVYGVRYKQKWREDRLVSS